MEKLFSKLTPNLVTVCNIHMCRNPPPSKKKEIIISSIFQGYTKTCVGLRLLNAVDMLSLCIRSFAPAVFGGSFESIMSFLLKSLVKNERETFAACGDLRACRKSTYSAQFAQGDS